ncbi:MAG TPA: polymer-forming cytoskeletal protein, partial [Polyangiaceae bacterium]|nr:polymer-forming cytoskeletal protein [Polyangiaceae bacterium]
MKSFLGSGLVGGLACAVVAASLTAAVAADARVKREGAWPDADKAVTLDLDGTPRRDALRKLADAAGWSLVVHAPPGDSVDIHVKAQPASKVMEILLDDGDYTVKRDGTLVSVEPTVPAGGAASAAPPAPPSPPTPAAAPVASAAKTPAPPPPPPAPVDSLGAKDVTIQLGYPTSQIDEPHKRGSDKTVMGGDVSVGKGETVRDLTVFGGNVDIEGQVSGDLTVFGGTAHVHEGAGVRGDATVFGGQLELDQGARVEGDVSCVGGEVERDPGSFVGGDVTVKGGHDTGNTSPDDENAGHAAALARHLHRDAHVSALRSAGESALHGVRLAA